MNAPDDQSTTDETPADETPADDTQAAVAEADETTTDDDAEEEGAFRMSLKADIESSGPCRKHVRVTIPRSDLDHFYALEVEELAENATVPGFRVGHVPKKLVQKRFQKELDDQVRQKVLVGSLEQVAEDYDLDPINEPDIDVEGIDIPDEGDFEFEFDVEVRPDFDLPQYEGLEIERPVRELSDEDTDDQMKRFLSQYGTLEDHGGTAESGDSLTLSVEFLHDGKELHKIGELVTELKPSLGFQDATIENFGELMADVKAGDTKEAEFQVSTEAETLEMRGETITAKLSVQTVQRMKMPELTPEFLTRLGVEDEDELRDEIKSMLHRQTTYQQRQTVRKQVLDKITESADWELPEEMVMKQVENALRREVLEMQQAGFTTPEIRSRENEIRQRAVTTTTQALKEHFVLDKIATEKNLEVTSTELEMEMQMMAMQRGESVRRVRAQLAKSGMDENLEAQIRERKAVDLILETAKFTDVPLDAPGESSVASVAHSVCGALTDVEDSIAEEETAGE